MTTTSNTTTKEDDNAMKQPDGEENDYETTVDDQVKIYNR